LLMLLGGLGPPGCRLFLSLLPAGPVCRKGFRRFGSFSSLLVRPFGFGRVGCLMSRFCGIPLPVVFGLRLGRLLTLLLVFPGLRLLLLGGVLGLLRPRMIALTPWRLSLMRGLSMWWLRKGSWVG
jgi:hypothetical protein